MTTSASPTARHLWTRARGVALAVALLLVAGVTVAALQSDTHHGELDPRSADPYGSRAIAELLTDRGVTTRVVAKKPGEVPRSHPSDVAAAAAATARDAAVAASRLATNERAQRAAGFEQAAMCSAGCGR